MESAPTEFCGLELISQPNSRSYCVEARIHSLCSWIFASRISLTLENRIAQFTFYGFTNFVYHFSFYLFDVNCAFLAVTDLRYCGKFYAVSLGNFASAEATKGFALWTPTTFEKVDETFAWLRSTGQTLFANANSFPYKSSAAKRNVARTCRGASPLTTYLPRPLSAGRV